MTTDIKHETKQNASHTPGQWQAHSEHDPLQIIGNIDGPDDGQMHYTRVCEVEDNAEAEANARLIAASPRLLAAGEAVLANWEQGDLAAAVRELADAVAEANGLAA